MNWTQPVCDDCWRRDNPKVYPLRIKDDYRETETCCHCGDETRSGIYVRLDPRTVAFPQEEVGQ